MRVYFSLFRILSSSTSLTSPRLAFTLNPFLHLGRFTYLVDTLEGIKSFKAQYRIPSGVSIRYCKQADWYTQRQEGKVVILMIAFIEEGMRIPMGRATRDYLIAHRLTLPESNKYMNKDFLIVLGEWHNGLHCPTREANNISFFY